MTGVKYIQAVVITLYRCIRSRKLTAAADKNRLTPVEKSRTYKRGNTAKRTVGVTRALVTIITITRATIEERRFTPLERTLETGNKYFGTYTFLISSPL